MKLKDILKDYPVSYLHDIPYFQIGEYTFFYYLLKEKEYFGVCLNKSLVRKSDLKFMNQQCRQYAKIICDQIALKNDLLFIELLEFDDIVAKLTDIAKLLKSMNYVNRKTCVLCGNKVAPLSFHQLLLPMDEICKGKLQKEFDDYHQNQQKHFKKAFFLGLLGAFLGIIPSLILAFILRSYSIISTLLLFLCPFLTIILFYKENIHRTLKNDLICGMLSFIFIIIYHLILIVICTHEHQITSIDMYFTILKNYVIESIIETLFVYCIGLISACLLCKPKLFIRLKKSL